IRPYARAGARSTATLATDPWQGCEGSKANAQAPAIADNPHPTSTEGWPPDHRNKTGWHDHHQQKTQRTRRRRLARGFAEMRTRTPKSTHGFIDRHGKPRFYLRRPGHKKVPLPGLPWSEPFMRAYQAALDADWANGRSEPSARWQAQSAPRLSPITNRAPSPT